MLSVHIQMSDSEKHTLDMPGKEGWESTSSPRTETGVHVNVHPATDIAVGADLERNFSMLSMLGLAFSLINSWTGK